MRLTKKLFQWDINQYLADCAGNSIDFVFDKTWSEAVPSDKKVYITADFMNIEVDEKHDGKKIVTEYMSDGSTIDRPLTDIMPEDDKYYIICTGVMIDFTLIKGVFKIETNVEDRTCPIPDEFCQTAGVKTIYETYEDGTLVAHSVNVQERPMPPGYVYTPTQSITFDILAERVKASVVEMEEKLAQARLSRTEKVEDYLYNTVYDLLDYGFANEWFRNNEVEVGLCSSIVREGFFGRNYDWRYDDTVEFVIKTPANNNRPSTIGVAFNPRLTKEIVEKGGFDEAYRILPFLTTDGINDAGVVCSLNVVPADKGYASGTEMCSLMIPRYILDNFTSAEAAVEDLRTKSIYTPSSIHEMGYEIHAMIADKDHVYVVEFVEGEMVVTEKAEMTNFYLNGVVFNADGSVKTPTTGDAVATNRVTDYASGLERWNIINSHTGTMRELLDKLKFTNAYKSTTSPFWYSEFVGGNVKVNSPISQFTPVVNTAIREYENRVRDGKTWQTVHSSVYDIDKKELRLICQEGTAEHFYKFNDFGAIVVEATEEIGKYAQDKIEDFNQNAIEKTNAFNSNAVQKTTDFNENADEKMREFDERVELNKFPNVTIVGSPTISHGNISGFSSANYCRFPFMVDFRGKPFEITFDIVTGQNVTNQENILDSDFGLAFAIRNARFVIAISTNGTSWDLGEGVGTMAVQPSTSYRIVIGWNGTQYTVKVSTDGGASYTTDITKNGTVQPYPRQIFIGVCENYGVVSNWFTGIINLNYASLYIDGQLAWLGIDVVGLNTRADVSLSNLDEDGIEYLRNIYITMSENIFGLYIDEDGDLCQKENY